MFGWLVGFFCVFVFCGFLFFSGIQIYKIENCIIFFLQKEENQNQGLIWSQRINVERRKPKGRIDH